MSIGNAVGAFAAALTTFTVLELSAPAELTVDPFSAPGVIIVLSDDDYVVREARAHSVLDFCLEANSRKMQWRDRVRVAAALAWAEKETGITIEDAAAIMWTESEMEAKAVSKLNDNGTRDHGIGQINDENIAWQIGAAAAALERAGIEHRHNDPYDPAIGAMATALHLAWTRNELIRKWQWNEDRGIVAYNMGVNGSKKWKETRRGRAYLQRWQKARRLIAERTKSEGL